MIKAICDWLLLSGVATWIKNTFREMQEKYLIRKVYENEKENASLKLEIKKLENKNEIEKKYDGMADSVVITSITRGKR
jgi:fructose 1,6-bisphosphatase